MAAAPHPSQNGGLCPEGQYCTTTAVGPQDCGNGEYNPDKGRSTCNNCPAGRLCVGLQQQAPADCPVGSYCPAKTTTTVNELKDCPAGTFGGVLNTGSDDDCIDCPIGRFCA